MTKQLFEYLAPSIIVSQFLHSDQKVFLPLLIGKVGHDELVSEMLHLWE